MPSDSDDDTYVTIGTPLEIQDEDEPRKKPVRPHETKVVDSRGRQRFHGAFTGGFSAGYFNSVGTKEGWTPSTFVSSRVDREAATQQQLPEHFMDNEDVGEHGIAPRTVATTVDFRDRNDKQASSTIGGIIPGVSPLEGLILPAKIPVAVKLLRQMGWKEGQGVGPRVKKKRKKKWGSQPPAVATNDTKVYGCALPTTVEDSDESDDEMSAGLTFAPKDVPPLIFAPKDNTHGLGYSGIAQNANRHFTLFEQPVVSSAGKKGIRGQAFGVGVFEDDDTDIYATDHLSNYDMQLGGPDENKHHGWTAPSDSRNSTRGIAAALEGFKLASAPAKPKIVYPPPKIPRDFKPFHHFDGGEKNDPSTSVPKRHSLTPKARSSALQDPSQIKSVFDIINTDDTCRLRLAQSKTKPNPPGVSTSRPEPTPAAQTVIKTEPDVSNIPLPPSDRVIPLVTGQPVSRSAIGRGVLGHSGCFKPFAKDPDKQARYESYMRRKGDEVTADSTSELTEWEHKRERTEFARAAQLYRPLQGVIASRFTRGAGDEGGSVASTLVKTEERSEDKAAKMKMFGTLTRTVEKWIPDKLLCKRFNVPNPYPDADANETMKPKKENFSVFALLSGGASSQRENEDRGHEDTPTAVTETCDEKVKDEGDEVAEVKDVVTSQPSTKETLSTADTSSKNLTEKTKRPPVDLFKAIFADSESSSDSEEEEEVSITHIEHMTPIVPVCNVKNEDADVMKIEDVTMTTGDNQPESSPVTTECQMYGPKLPDPAVTILHASNNSVSTSHTVSGQSCSQEDGSRHRKHSKHKHKAKSAKQEHKKKSKEKKSRHKKDRSSHRKRSRRRSSSGDSSSQSDESDIGQHDTDKSLDTRLKQRLKRLDASKKGI